MSRKSATLEIPDDLCEQVKQVAEASERSPEAILLESIDVLFRQPSASVNIDRLLNELPQYSDAQLWGVVNRQLPWPQTLRLRELSGRGKHTPSVPMNFILSVGWFPIWAWNITPKFVQR